MKVRDEEYYIFKEDVIVLLQYVSLQKGFWDAVPEEIKNKYRESFVNPEKIDEIFRKAEDMAEKIKNPNNVWLVRLNATR